MEQKVDYFEFWSIFADYDYYIFVVDYGRR